MYKLFNHSQLNQSRWNKPTRYDFILDFHRENLRRIINFYKISRYAVRSNHLLVQLIEQMPHSFSSTDYEYKDLLIDYTEELSRVFKISSLGHLGSSRYPGTFLGVDSEELYISFIEDFDVNQLKGTWELESPIRFLRHPKTDLNANLLLGQSQSEEFGLSVIYINIPLLGCQYRLWRNQQVEQLGEEGRGTIMHFVSEVVLPNSIPSFLDIAFFNRLHNHLLGKPVSMEPDKHPFFINNRLLETDRILKQIIETNINNRQSFRHIIESVECVTESSLHSLFTIPDNPVTRQIAWTLLLARSPLLHFFLEWDKQSGGQHNRGDLQIIRRTLRQIRSDNGLSQLGSNHLKETGEEEILIQIPNYLK